MVTLCYVDVGRHVVLSVRRCYILSRDTREGPMKFTITLARDEDGVWIAECPSIPGCVSQGETRKAAVENVKEAIQLCLEVRSEKGLPLTIETAQVEVVA